MFSVCLILFCFTAEDIVLDDLMYRRTWFSSLYLAMVPCSDVYDENSSPTFNIDDGGDGESGSINDERAARVMEREGKGWDQGILTRACVGADVVVAV